MGKIYQIFKQYKYKLSFIYMFMLFSELSILSQPFLLGKSIDGLLIGNWFWLVLLGISYFLSSFFNYKRMVYDTIVYSGIYNDIIFKFLGRQDIDISKKVARTDMAHQIVAVLEGYVHYYISTIVTIVGSIWIIYSENWRVGIIVSFAFIFIILCVLIFYKKIRQAIHIRNNHYENKVMAIGGGFERSVSFFRRRRRLEIFESTLQGKNWFFVNNVKNFFLLVSIIVLVLTTKDITIGGVLTVYSYVSNFLISLLSIPVGFEMYSRLVNIMNRID